MRDLRIGLWGAPSSGKTVYLAALGIATLRWPRKQGTWQVKGADQPSQDFLLEQTHLLASGRFPPATQQPVRYRWSLRLVRGRRSVGFILDALDLPGGSFEDVQLKPGGWFEDFVTCDGFLYLHDPLLKESHGYVLPMLQRLGNVVDSRGGLLKDGCLAQHLAICMSKFDDKRIFGRAREQGFVRQGVPSAPPDLIDPRAYFQDVAHPWVASDIAKWFRPERTRHYSVSAIGFRVGPDGNIRMDDCDNTRIVDGELRVAGEVRPLNILEPLLWLKQQIRSEPPPRAAE